MKTVTPDLCDAHAESVRVVAPLFRDYGGHAAFGGVTFHPGEFVYADNNGIIVSAQRLV